MLGADLHNQLVKLGSCRTAPTGLVTLGKFLMEGQLLLLFKWRGLQGLSRLVWLQADCIHDKNGVKYVHNSSRLHFFFILHGIFPCVHILGIPCASAFEVEMLF